MITKLKKNNDKSLSLFFFMGKILYELYQLMVAYWRSNVNVKLSGPVSVRVFPFN